MDPAVSFAECSATVLTSHTSALVITYTKKVCKNIYKPIYNEPMCCFGPQQEKHAVMDVAYCNSFVKGLNH